MGLDLTYEANGRDFNVRLSMADWQTVHKLKAHLPDAVAACFDLPDFGERAVIPLAVLRASVEQIDALLRDRPELLPHTYQMKVEYMQVGDRRVPFGNRFDTGCRSGFRLPGDEQHWYAICAGTDECRLEKWAALPDGTGTLVEQRDLRGETELLTANAGVVRFRKRRAKTSLRKALQEVGQFLAEARGPDVTKVLG